MTLHGIVVSCSHILTLWCDVIYDVIRHMLQAYNRPGAASWGDSWFNSWWVRRYTCMHRLMCWCRPCWESLLPSNLTDWVIIICPCVPASADAPIHSENGPGVLCSDLRSTISTGPSCLSVGAHVHYLLSCQVYISGSALPKGKTFCPTVWHTSQLLASLGGRQLKWHEWPD